MPRTFIRPTVNYVEISAKDLALPEGVWTWICDIGVEGMKQLADGAAPWIVCPEGKPVRVDR